MHRFFITHIAIAIPLGLADLRSSIFFYFIACKIIHPIHYGLLVYGAAKRNSTVLLTWIILTGIIVCVHAIAGFLAPAIIMIVVPPEYDWKPHAYTMMITSFFAVIANVWAIFVSWKARKEIKDLYKQEEPEGGDKMENIAEISSTIQQ